MSDFDDLSREVQDGMNGKNSGIPMGFVRLNNHISIRRAMYYLAGGYTGSGKTAFVDDAFVLNPIDYLIRFEPEGIDMDIIYFSQERRKNFKLAKWICRRIFLSMGYVIPVDRMLGWVEKKNRLTFDEHDLFLQHNDYINSILEKVDIVEGPQNPTGIKMYIDEYAKKNGILNMEDKYHPIYTPYKENKIVLIITDTVQNTKGEKDFPKGKAAIDKSSSDKQRFRDVYGYSILDVSQFNRSIANPMRIKNGDVEPQLEDFKETSETQENADIILTLFDPWRYKVPDPSGYNLDLLRDDEGRKKYRNLKIVKNTYGSDDIRIGLSFQPQIGLFKEMPKLAHMQQSHYDNIVDNTYFLPER